MYALFTGSRRAKAHTSLTLGSRARCRIDCVLNHLGSVRYRKITVRIRTPHREDQPSWKPHSPIPAHSPDRLAIYTGRHHAFTASDSANKLIKPVTDLVRLRRGLGLGTIPGERIR